MSGVHCALLRVKMPAGLPLSGLIAWMHRVISKHQESNRRWVKANPTARAISDAYHYHHHKPKLALSPDEQRARRAVYMKKYRARMRARKLAMIRKVKQEDWQAWRARDEAKKKARRERWARRFPWKIKKA
jgi:hypothetical protein